MNSTHKLILTVLFVIALACFLMSLVIIGKHEVNPAIDRHPAMYFGIATVVSICLMFVVDWGFKRRNK